MAAALWVGVGFHQPELRETKGELLDGDDLVAPSMRKEIPVIVSWKDPTVHRSELPSSTLKPTPSEVTDLGDRAFYADLNARRRESADAFALEDYEECSTLEDMFLEAIVNSFEESKCFFPRALLSTLVTQDRVFKELSSILTKHTTPARSMHMRRKFVRRSPCGRAMTTTDRPGSSRSRRSS
jgi:hypothetical protein